jgi:hypothetical protein
MCLRQLSKRRQVPFFRWLTQLDQAIDGVPGCFLIGSPNPSRVRGNLRFDANIVVIIVGGSPLCVCVCGVRWSLLLYTRMLPLITYCLYSWWTRHHSVAVTNHSVQVNFEPLQPSIGDEWAHSIYVARQLFVVEVHEALSVCR